MTWSTMGTWSPTCGSRTLFPQLANNHLPHRRRNKQFRLELRRVGKLLNWVADPSTASTISTSTRRRAGLSACLRPHPFVAQPDRSVRVGLAFCQPELALRELAREAGDAIA